MSYESVPAVLIHQKAQIHTGSQLLFHQGAVDDAEYDETVSPMREDQEHTSVERSAWQGIQVAGWRRQTRVQCL